MKSPKYPLPSWAMYIVKLLVHVDFREEIEGDLSEKYQADITKFGFKKANKLLFTECISLVKLNLFFNLNYFSSMKSQNWFKLFFISLLVIIGSISPFLPGPSNDITHSLSRFAQTIGFTGLAFAPFALIWLIIEWRNKKEQTLNRWTNGYYPAWLTMTPIFVFIPLQIARSIYFNDRIDFDLWPIAIIIFIIGFCIYRIRKLKNKTSYKFNVVPIYILFIPFIAMLCSKLAIQRAALYTRENVIEKTEPLLQALEKYKINNGDYPNQLDDLVGHYILKIPTFQRMGLRAYQYEKKNGSYQLSFEQKYHWFATEVVAFMKYGHEITKANYENFPTSHTHWRYFMVD